MSFYFSTYKLFNKYMFYLTAFFRFIPALLNQNKFDNNKNHIIKFLDGSE